jgi:hypothetical protein
MMGPFGVMMLNWMRALEGPGAQAILIALGAALVSLGCHRLAAVIEHNVSG